MISEDLGPTVLIVSHYERIGFADYIANPHVGIGFAIGAVDDDLVNRPFPRGGPELEGLLRYFGEGGLQDVGTILVALDQGGTFGGGHFCHSSGAAATGTG